MERLVSYIMIYCQKKDLSKLHLTLHSLQMLIFILLSAILFLR